MASVRTAQGDGRGGWAPFLKLVYTNIKTWLTKWLLEKAKTRLTKRVLVWTGPDPLCRIFGFEPPSNTTAIILNNPAPHCDRQTLHIHTYNPVHYI